MAPQQKSNLTSWITSIIALVSLALSAVVFGQKWEKLDRVSQQADSHERKFEEHEKAISEQDRKISEMVGDIRVIRTILERKQ